MRPEFLSHLTKNPKKARLVNQMGNSHSILNGMLDWIPTMTSAGYRADRRSHSVAVVRVDDRGRITIPKKIREELDIEEGDTCFIDFEDHSFHIVRGENPFAVLARDALKQHEQGRTVTFEEATASFVEADDHQGEESSHRAVMEEAAAYRPEDKASSDLVRRFHVMTEDETERLAEQIVETMSRRGLIAKQM
jgi:AbrB family looped-hinge helix DNA binding protein